VIVSFGCAETERIFRGAPSRRFPPDIQNLARRKLEYLHRARTLDDLRMPPGNRLEALKGDRKGEHSIRVNDKWRICFEWQAGNAGRVEIVDYH
jgi:proteic killer suppression protein